MQGGENQWGKRSFLAENYLNSSRITEKGRIRLQNPKILEKMHILMHKKANWRNISVFRWHKAPAA